MAKVRLGAATNLADLWLATLDARGLTTTQGLRAMNAALGTGTTHSRVREWARGLRTPDAVVAAWMLDQALPDVLESMFLTPRQMAYWGPVLRRALSLPQRAPVQPSPAQANGAGFPPPPQPAADVPRGTSARTR